MKATVALQVIADITASQWGMVTTAQAGALGVPRLMLARLAEAGHLERLAQGVYRDAGAPSDEFEDLRAAWLSTEPKLLAEERLSDLKTRRDQLVARQKTAQAQAKVADAMGSINLMDPTSELSRYEDKVRRSEAQVLGQQELASSSLESQFAELETDSSAVEIEARLAALKNK